MSEYFENNESAGFAYGEKINPALEMVANKYVAENPAQPFVFRLSSSKGLRRNNVYRYVMDFEQIYPNAKNEQLVYAWGKLWSNSECEENFIAIPYSPMTVYINGVQKFYSDFYEEKTMQSQKLVCVRLKKGWNSFVIRFTKTALGFGGEFGTSFFKGKPWHFLAPTPEREGQEGFIYSGLIDSLEEIPQLSQSEVGMMAKWYPQCSFDAVQSQKGQLSQIFGLKRGCFAYGWSKILLLGNTTCNYGIRGRCSGPVTVYINGHEVFENGEGTFDSTFQAKGGLSDLLVECVCGENDWGFEISITSDKGEIIPLSPCNIKGTNDPWIYAGAFKIKQDPVKLASMTRVFDTADGYDYWRVDLPDMYVRPFLETINFGNWNYPLGVTLYGLWQLSKVLHRQDLKDYVRQHVEQCTAFYEYSIWDKEKFGAAGIDSQISSVDSLDDCGSFSSTMLEVSPNYDLAGCRRIADNVADYISNKQSRLSDGSLYRRESQLKQMINTMWLDDLYMSVPFLMRYYQLTGDKKYCDDAAQQFLLYRKKMYIPELKVMSHVYYTDRKIANGIPWGRGNGWVLFSLSELLQILPEGHQLRGELLSFFNDLCEGYGALQDDKGMWHQVLNDWESYSEASCTSMFISAFARGVRYGWLHDTAVYREKALKGWKGLINTSVDKYGNIYGICQGSGHSFTPHYYKDDLGWILNDTHGIGIFLIAGTEVERMITEFSLNKI